LEADRRSVFEKKKVPAPGVKIAFEVGRSAPERVVRRAAMLALTSVRGQEAETFKSLARFVKEDGDRHAAVQALLRIPTRDWPKGEAKPLLATLLAYVRKVPTAERTSPAVLDAMQLADSLASLLPLKEAQAARRE